MTAQTFSLIPFQNSDLPAIQITGKAGRQNGRLTIEYSICGETASIRFPERSMPPMRKHGLWSSTCFEIFLAIPDHPQYWEFNLSPSGDWNVYHMEGYRRVGFREEASIQRLPFEVSHEASRVLLNVEVDLRSLVSEHELLQLGISCVIQCNDDRESYWALAHPQPTPDFHLRESFIIQL